MLFHESWFSINSKSERWRRLKRQYDHIKVPSFWQRKLEKRNANRQCYKKAQKRTISLKNKIGHLKHYFLSIPLKSLDFEHCPFWADSLFRKLKTVKMDLIWCWFQRWALGRILASLGVQYGNFGSSFSIKSVHLPTKKAEKNLRIPQQR